MPEKRKIKIMTALAIYDEKYGKKDRLADENFKSDYIYKRNSSLRVGIVIGYILIFMFYMIIKVFSGNIEIVDFDYMLYVKIWGIPLAVILVFYTILGHFIFGREYKESQERLTGYHELMKILHKEKPEASERAE
ncbi:MAG: hypothetical protein VB120_04255 [Lachnospiraceae bacterium]|nr:hypothetical protein [Lachnospiraceae bacterium]